MTEPRPCVGCGYCCRKSPCMRVFLRRGGSKFIDKYIREKKVCPELRWDGTRYWCHLVEKDPREWRELAVGQGCCSPLNTDRGHIPSPEKLGLIVRFRKPPKPRRSK